MLLLGAIASSILTKIFDITIPRFNNVFTASWLIYVGMFIVQRYKVRFNNTNIFIISVIVFYSFAVLRGNVHLNSNRYDDIASLTISSFTALYIIAYISKKCKGHIAKILAMIGKESFYIMGLHFLAFKLGSVVLNKTIGTNLDPAELEAPALTFLLYAYYLCIGVVLPVAMIWIWRKGIMALKNKLSQYYAKI